VKNEVMVMGVGESPPTAAITAAIETARMSPCAKSKRGVVIFRRTKVNADSATDTVDVFAAECNGPPGDVTCTGDRLVAIGQVGVEPSRSTCIAHCREVAVHAETRALRYAYRDYTYEGAEGIELLHVKVDATGALVAGGSPSCSSCSREILDEGIPYVWLYQATSFDGGARWVRYSASAFHHRTLRACGLPYEAAVVAYPADQVEL